MLVRNGAELMLQTKASVTKDAPQFAPGQSHADRASLFLEVDDFADTLKRPRWLPDSHAGAHDFLRHARDWSVSIPTVTWWFFAVKN